MQNVDCEQIFDIQFRVMRVLYPFDNGRVVVSVDARDVECDYRPKCVIQRLKIDTVAGTITGDASSIVGCTYHALAHIAWYENHHEYQYELLEPATLVMPKVKSDIVKFLTKVQSVGKSTACKIYDIYGDDTIQKILTDKTAESKIADVTNKTTATAIVKYVQNLAGFNLAMNYCREHNLSVSTALIMNEKNVFDWRACCYDDVSGLLEVYKALDGALQFSQIDDIAEKIYKADKANGKNWTPYSYGRLDGMIMASVRLGYTGGASCFPLSQLATAALDVMKNANTSHFKNDVYTLETIKARINELIDLRVLVVANGKTEPMVYTDKMYKMEKSTAKNLARRIKRNKGGLGVVPKQNQKLDETQNKAVREALNNPVTVLTGGAGTGKTYTINAIINAVKEAEPDAEILLMSPSAKAARHMSEVTGLPASTIHSALRLKLDGTPTVKDFCPSATLIVIDEVSMVNGQILNKVIERTSSPLLVLVGDDHQLPAIGGGDTLQMLGGCYGVAHVDLNTVHRQGKDSEILNDANRVRRGYSAGLTWNTQCMYSNVPDNVIAEKTSEMVKALMNNGVSINDIMCLAPIHHGACGTYQINACIQSLVNPNRTSGITLESTGENISVNDRVMVLVNSKTGKNGDVGTVRKITEKRIYIDMDNGRQYSQEISTKTTNLGLAYAMTVHKSQGCEAPIVIMVSPSDSKARRMMQNNLIYTGMTRAKDAFILIGNMDSFLKGIERTQKEKDFTLFSDMFNKEYNED